MYTMLTVLALIAGATVFRRAFSAIVPCVTPDGTGGQTSTLGELLKEVYDPVIAEILNREASSWNEFGEGEDKLGGEGWFFETQMQGNQGGIGARAEKAVLPVADHQYWRQGVIQEKSVYGTGELTGQIIEKAKSNAEAFASARSSEMDGLTKDVIKDLNRQFFGSGRGVLATVSADGPGTQDGTVTDGLNLRIGMVIDTHRPIGTPVAALAGRRITNLSALAAGTMVFTVDGAAPAFVAGDVLLRTGAFDNEITGLDAIVDDGGVAATYLNISRTTYPLWKANVLANAGTARALTLDLMQQAEDAVTRAGDQVDLIRMNLGQRRKYFDIVGPDKRYMSGRLDGGYERLDYNGKNLTIDIDCPKGRIFFLKRSTIKKYFLRRLGILDFDGQVLRQVAGSDVWRWHIGAYCNLGCKMPNRNSVLKDLSEPSELQYVG